MLEQVSERAPDRDVRFTLQQTALIALQHTNARRLTQLGANTNERKVREFVVAPFIANEIGHAP